MEGGRLMSDFRFGIWGCGLISTFHADAIQKIEGAVLIGAYDLNSEAKNKLCAAHQAKAFSSAEELVCSPDIDAVCICLPMDLPLP